MKGKIRYRNRKRIGREYIKAKQNSSFKDWFEEVRNNSEVGKQWQREDLFVLPDDPLKLVVDDTQK
jgi:hypothetical protein